MKPISRKQLVEKLALAAWSVLNHDNDPEGKGEWNAYNWRRLRYKIEKVLQDSGIGNP